MGTPSPAYAGVSKKEYILSLVVPGIFDTKAELRYFPENNLKKQLNKVDFPTFGLPIIATTGKPTLSGCNSTGSGSAGNFREYDPNDVVKSFRKLHKGDLYRNITTKNKLMEI